MTRRLTLPWPDPRPFQFRDWEPIRLLAASDERDPALDFAANRDALGRIDLVIGCGDLEPGTLAFLGDAFNAPLLYVRGNHDRGGAWHAAGQIPEPTDGVDVRSLAPLALLGLGWPGSTRGQARRDEAAAWWQVGRSLNRRLLRPPDRPWLVFSHVPPRDVGDSPDDPYHVGFGAYRLALDQLRPRLWLHGHTSRAAQRTPVIEHGPTTVVNVTPSVLVELQPVF